MTRPLLLIMAASGLFPAATLVAADFDEQAWVITAEFLPNHFDYTITSENGTFSDEEDAAQYGLALGWRRSFAVPGARHGPGIGIEVATSRAEIVDGTLEVYEARATAAWGMAISHEWSIWGGARGHYGYANLDLSDATSFGDLEADGTGWGYEPWAAVAWAPTEHLGAHLSLGWRMNEYDLESDDFDIDLENGGLAFGIGLEWRPAAGAQRLE